VWLLLKKFQTQIGVESASHCEWGEGLLRSEHPSPPHGDIHTNTRRPAHKV
jgi:hypothetical protein